MANDTKPSESASWHFDQARRAVEFTHIGSTDQADYLKRLAISNHHMAGGLKDLSVALRATYILLEQVNRKLSQ